MVLNSIDHRAAGPEIESPASAHCSNLPIHEVTLPEMAARRARGIVYGPVRSRRFGHSLGLNVLPQGAKRCPFNCVYCEVGASKPVSCPSADDYPAPEAVLVALETALRDGPALEAITFSGSGEPTLHPQFRELVEGAVRLRDRHCPSAQVAVLSNAALADRPEVRAGLALADVRVMKLDAGDPATYEAINRPAEDISFDLIVENLSRLDDIVLQTLLLGGVVSNVEPAARACYLRLVQKLQPARVQLYSIARSTPVADIHPVSPEILRSLAAKIDREAGISADVY